MAKKHKKVNDGPAVTKAHKAFRTNVEKRGAKFDKALHEVLGVSRQNLTQTLKHSPTLRTIAKYAKALKCRVSDLVK